MNLKQEEIDRILEDARKENEKEQRGLWLGIMAATFAVCFVALIVSGAQ